MKLAHDKVNITNLCSQIKSKLYDIDYLMKRTLFRELIITSGNDSDHSPNSKHYVNAAIDFRVSDWICNVEVMAVFFTKLRELFPVGLFDIIFEGNHIHLEYDPK